MDGVSMNYYFLNHFNSYWDMKTIILILNSE